MGKAGRFACIFIPMVLTMASLVCLIFVFLAQREAHNSTTNRFYFFRTDTSNFTVNPNTDLFKGTKLDDNILNAIAKLRSNGTLDDFYQVGLWDYCSGNKTNGHFKVGQCSKPKANYFFNVTEVWGLTSDQNDMLPKTLKDGLKIYKKVAHWMFIAYSIALGVTAAEIVVGFFAIFSRWGSCVTTIVSSASTMFTILAAITSTVLSTILVGAFESLKPYGVRASLGVDMLRIVWLAVAFSMAAGLFWTFSTCCCSGKSGYKRDGGIRRQGTIAEHMPYTHASQGYKSIGPEQGGEQHYASGGMSGMPMANTGHGRQLSAGYEPYRAV